MWGFIRETKESAKKAGIDEDTGVNRTGLDDYLAVIFPNTKDWIHDKMIDDLPVGVKSKKRPDYRSKSLMLIVEFDGLNHYTSPYNIERDYENTKFYESLGYKVVRIPYFIQLSNSAVKTLFNVDVNEPLFDESIPSMGPKGKNTPAYLCYEGLKRMATEFRKFPTQYKTNMHYLTSLNDEFNTGASLLARTFEELNMRNG